MKLGGIIFDEISKNGRLEGIIHRFMKLKRLDRGCINMYKKDGRLNHSKCPYAVFLINIDCHSCYHCSISHTDDSVSIDIGGGNVIDEIQCHARSQGRISHAELTIAIYISGNDADLFV